MKFKCNWVIKGGSIIEADSQEEAEKIMLDEEIMVPLGAELTDWECKPSR